MRYRKKPLVIEAIQLTKNNVEESAQFIKEPYMIRVVWMNDSDMYTDVKNDDFQSPGIWIKTLEGDYLAKEGDYIIQGIDGEYYPCKPDIIEKRTKKLIKKGKENE